LSQNVQILITLLSHQALHGEVNDVAPIIHDMSCLQIHWTERHGEPGRNLLPG